MAGVYLGHVFTLTVVAKAKTDLFIQICGLIQINIIMVLTLSKKGKYLA